MTYPHVRAARVAAAALALPVSLGPPAPLAVASAAAPTARHPAPTRGQAGQATGFLPQEVAPPTFFGESPDSNPTSTDYLQANPKSRTALTLGPAGLELHPSGY